MSQVSLEHCAEHVGSCKSVTTSCALGSRRGERHHKHAGALSVLLSIVSNTMEAVTMSHPLGSDSCEQHQVGNKKDGKAMQKRRSDYRELTNALLLPWPTDGSAAARCSFGGWLPDSTHGQSCHIGEASTE